jgi:hypothetical protein
MGPEPIAVDWTHGVLKPDTPPGIESEALDDESGAFVYFDDEGPRAGREFGPGALLD